MKKTKVLFIVPPSVPIGDLRRTDKPNLQWNTTISVPLGLLSIASYTGKYADADYKILDLNLEINEKKDEFNSIKWDKFLMKQLSEFNEGQRPDIVGISAIFNSNAGYLNPVSATAKRLWPGVLVVAGGGLPTNMSSYVFDSAPDIDALAIGEGEKPFTGLVLAGNKQEYLNTARGWMTRERMISDSSPTMDLVADLDDIPLLNYDLVDMKKYYKCGRYHGEKESNETSISIMTSRGCPYRCTFCASHSVHGHKMRCHSPEYILAAVREAKEKYGTKILLVEDDHFLGHNKNAINILRGIAQEGMTVEFVSGLSVRHLNEETVDALKDAGLKMATIAVESGCERVLKEIIRKPFDLTVVRDAVAMLRKRDMYVRAFFIVGFPGETKEEIMETVRFMKEVGLNWIAIMIATPTVGSELYEICRKNNLFISDKLEDFYFGKCNIKLAHSTPEQLEELRYLINLEVNFVQNYDLRNGHFGLALTGFLDVINRVPNHAFAYYYASICYRKMGKADPEKQCMSKFQEIVDSSKDWSRYAKHFNLDRG
ncbi:B12-binding domain-containing radical SAM protein [Candidatus Omnitrophota bacterium]